MENHYNRLNRKLDHLLRKQPKRTTHPHHSEECHFYTRVQNLTNIKFNKEEMQLLKYGFNCNKQTTHVAFSVV
jgi:ribosomal protein L33